jgi:glycerol-3-phosphate dehydrogenase (NAD(P)+)
MQTGIIGSGSWGTALAKLLTENNQPINWWIRNEETIQSIIANGFNPNYLPSAGFNTALLNLSSDLLEVIRRSDILVIAIPSAYAESVLNGLPVTIFENKRIVSAIKGILPGKNQLLNDYLKAHFNFPLENYFTVMGPCHAEEVAARKLSYLTFSGLQQTDTQTIAALFKTPFLNTVINHDVFGVQYAAVLKNIYAVGAGIAQGLDYGDNFKSVLIANSADEMANFLRKAGIMNAEVGYIDHDQHSIYQNAHTNYAASVYLGDLLVTCYSAHSRNRTFGIMIGEGADVQTAQTKMRMVAEGFNASHCMYLLNQSVQCDMPIAETVYKILWEGLPADEGFRYIETVLV